MYGRMGDSLFSRRGGVHGRYHRLGPRVEAQQEIRRLAQVHAAMEARQAIPLASHDMNRVFRSEDAIGPHEPRVTTGDVEMAVRITSQHRIVAIHLARITSPES